jgi:ribonuclease VapC
VKIFADASALVAILAREPDAIALADRLEAAQDRLYSAVSAWETTAALCRSYAMPPDLARNRVEHFLARLSLRMVPIAAAEFAIAAEAYARFGKGRHKAGLNMGDCFAYACARCNDAKLLFLGEGFTHTDIAAAPI